MGNYFVTVCKEDCSGCGACALRCPRNAITMQEDGEGFIYPYINQQLCIGCGICRNICPNSPREEKKGQQTYIAINKNAEDKRRSASGGMFYPMAKQVIEQGGVIFGVTWDSHLRAVHDYAETLQDAQRFQGSKYVRSDLRDSYQRARMFLEQGRHVLFTGTPCQCAGLYAYLGKDMPGLLTCEVICLANSSPKILEDYIKNLERESGKKVRDVIFRGKETGWRDSVTILVFDDGSKTLDDNYVKAFFNQLINRPSCHRCRYASESRHADFTIGDFWGIEKIAPEVEDDDTGISLLNVNTEKGKDFLGKIENQLMLKPVDTKAAFSYNHHCNVKAHRKRKSFFQEISDGSINETNIIDSMQKYLKKPFYRRVLGKVKRTLLSAVKKK